MKVLEEWNLKSNKILASVHFPYLCPLLISPVLASPFKSQIGDTGSNMSVLPGTVLHFHRAVDSDQKQKTKKKQTGILHWKKFSRWIGGVGERFSKIPGYSPVIQEINLWKCWPWKVRRLYEANLILRLICYLLGIEKEGLVPGF